MHDSEQEHSGITGCRVTYESTIFYNEANKFSIIVVKTNDPRIPLQACSGRYYGDRMLRFTAVGYELPRRDDPPGKSGAKYIWLSSVGRPHGVTSGSPLHFVGEPFAKTVYVTEGLLKADIAHCLTGRSFVAVAGVNNLNGLESALCRMAQNGTKLVVEAYDMDKLENDYVGAAAEKVQQIANTAGLQSTSLVWNPAYKGIDDWQLAP